VASEPDYIGLKVPPFVSDAAPPPPRRRRPRGPWPVKRLLAENRNAGTVYLAVVALAAGRRWLGTTRAAIGAVCGLSDRRVGTALAALHTARWLFRRYKRGDGKMWFRLMLTRGFLRRVGIENDTRVVRENVPQTHVVCRRAAALGAGGPPALVRDASPVNEHAAEESWPTRNGDSQSA
jgi:hypothetical protein